MSAVLISDDFEMPLGIRSLRDFRRWMRSPSFPQTGRVDYIGGTIEVHMSPEQLFSHGGPKEAIARTLAGWNFEQKLGKIAIDSMRYVSIPADLSCEPDLLFVSYDSIEAGRVRLIPAMEGRPDDCLELEGAVDLIVEILSNSSVKKDTQRLPTAYFRAGVEEYWLVDARGEDELLFAIQRRGKTSFRRARADAEGYQKSHVFGKSFRLTRQRDRHGYWEFELQMR